jgi:hypothetical protein
LHRARHDFFIERNKRARSIRPQRGLKEVWDSLHIDHQAEIACAAVDFSWGTHRFQNEPSGYAHTSLKRMLEREDLERLR